MTPSAITRRSALACLAVVVCLAAAGRDCRAGDRVFRKFTGDHGLSQLSVSEILQDRDGYLWVGTQAGVNRYDGETFVTRDTRDGLPNDWINALAQAADGSIWVGTNQGVARIDATLAVEDLGYALDDVTRLLAERDGSMWLVPPSGSEAFLTMAS